MIVDSSKIKDGTFDFSDLVISIQPVLVISQDTSLKMISSSFEELTGFSGKELEGRKAPYPWWTEETLIKNSNTLGRIIDGDSGGFIELYRKKNGEQFCAEVDSQIIANYHGEKHYLIRLVDVVRFENIDRIQMGLELYTHKLIQNASYPILVVNPDSSIKCVNHALEEMTGYRAHELVGIKAPYPWCTSAEKSIGYDILNSTEQTRCSGVWRIEKALHNRFGKLYWIEVTGIPVLRAGKLQYYVCNWRDITEQKLLEQKITKTGSKLDSLSTYMDSTLKEERKKITRELQDEIGQSLTSLKMNLASFKGNFLPGQDTLQKRTESMHKLVDTTLARVEKLCAELGLRVPEEWGLASDIKSPTTQFQESSITKCGIVEEIEEPTDNHKLPRTSYRVMPQKSGNAGNDTRKSVSINLSPREFQIMCMIARGMRLTDIAKELYLSVKTVSTYRTNILTKMNYSTNAELTHYAIANKLVEWQ